ncbi:MAG: ABC transporter permease [Capsulimonadales bacterium]|nr:ABC transporter permease [Capsulimonadales bacterium]
MSVLSRSVFASVTTHRELVENLILRDVRARYKQSALGYAWAVFHPLMLALIYTLVGGFFLGQASSPGLFALQAYMGVLFWQLFATGLMTATEGLVSHLSLITKVYFPREVFPVSAVASKLFDFAFGLVGLIPFMVIYRVFPGPGIWLVIPLLLIQVLFTTGLGLLTSAANLFYRDVRYLVQLALGLMIYLVPNLYPLSRVESHPWFYRLYLLNPMAVIIEASRRATFSEFGPVEPLIPYILLAGLTSVLVFGIGYVVFKRQEPHFAEFV